MKTFYWYFRPLATIAKLFGVFPLQNILTSDPKRLTHKYVSWSNLYSGIIFTFYIYTIFYFSGSMLYVKTSLFQEFVVYLVLLRSFLSFGFCSGHSKLLPKLICLLDSFDKKKSKVLIVKYNSWYVNIILWTLVPAMVSCLILAVSFYNYGQLIRGLLPPASQSKIDGYVVSSCFSFLSIWQTIPMLSYVYFGWKIRCNFKDINYTLKKKGYTGNFLDEDKKYDDDMGKTIKDIRYMHNMLSQCVGELGKCYGSFLALDHVFIIVVVVVNIGAFIYSADHNIYLLIVTGINAAMFLNVTMVSQDIKIKGMAIIHLFNGIKLSEISTETQNEIKMLMTQLTLCPVEVSAAGFFVLDKSKLASIITSVATHLIVMIQFIQEETKLNCNSTNFIDI